MIPLDCLEIFTTTDYVFQEYILHHAMSIFTFMGDSLLQQDDSHTFQVITSTLNTLIPAIVQVSRSLSRFYHFIVK